MKRISLFAAAGMIATLSGWISVASARHSPSQPYKDDVAREIKALSPGEIDGYRNGRGMGLARAAELNSYPGPMHVLELAEELRLTAKQKARARELKNSMHQAARIGGMIVEEERKLDRLFASGNATEARTAAIIQEIGRLQALNRWVHLRAHIRMRQALTPQQIARYDELRGYSNR